LSGDGSNELVRFVGKSFVSGTSVRPTRLAPQPLWNRIIGSSTRAQATLASHFLTFRSETAGSKRVRLGRRAYVPTHQITKK